MSDTRSQVEAALLSEERFASSPEYGRGLMANLVARRCSLLDSEEDRELVWWVQGRSLQLGGVEKFTRELMQRFPDRLATRTMQRLGLDPKRIYPAEEVKAIRREFPDGKRTLMLHGELTRDEQVNKALCWRELKEDGRRTDEELERYERDANGRPASYPAADLQKRCRAAAGEHLLGEVQSLCLDPALKVEACAPWYFPTLVATLREWRAAEIAGVRKTVVVTEVGQNVFDALDYALAERCMVLVEGNERIGKTFAAKAWTALHAGCVRYFQVPASTDDISFFRAIAASLGVSINLNSKAHQLRDRVEQVLQTGQLMLVADEAHYLWPQSRYREALPQRINWLLTALVNYGVPVALVCTPQFFEEQRALKRRVAWRDGQFIGRVGHHAKLPDSVSRPDLRAVAKSLLPEGDEMTWKILVTYALTSARYLAGIETAVKRARFLARREGRDAVTASLIARAIEESVMPSDERLAASLAEPGSKRRRTPAVPVPAAEPPADARASTNPSPSPAGAAGGRSTTLVIE